MSVFRFRKFSVDDSLCGMKTGTDGVLLGAWSPLPSSLLSGGRCLDIGTGSGLIALMLAQRTAEASEKALQSGGTRILGIDISADCVRQARLNFASSPWADRLVAEECDLRAFGSSRLAEENTLFDLIVSNPPFFTNSLRNPDISRSTARHDDTLPLTAILSFAASRLSPSGGLALVLPAGSLTRLTEETERLNLAFERTTHVRTRAGKEAKRVLVYLTLGASGSAEQNNPPLCDELVLTDNDGEPRSRAYRNLTKDFYL